ncbi:hypothetical protein CBLAS_1047 [Campylobacter blaseri]|uniref:Uncharacterized protein n=1 Tax=Campylobacter blaseri TaxID=2042961 RepID=A0A2P8QYG4_9BACT|nr:hypothetical protein [Campylobacter blaseri]PSM51303.1 hypothetical protein CQ405_08720 [Campylobacter blaseri]PSM52447.1 hypothetical protein CRN67_08725 [Campylobacter blaseri]QKF86224.1 hypothetical protein CBLAS_1047 [Campylobacter blaseri]
MIEEYPEVYSFEESIKILDKYKNKITQEQYNSIKSNIGNFAIEDMYLNEKDILTSIRILKGETTADEKIKKLKKEWGLI